MCLKHLIEDVKKEWTRLWAEHYHDRNIAEGIADKDYPLLFVDQGLVVAATRDFKPPSLSEVVEKHRQLNSNSDEDGDDVVSQPNPTAGGWGKFSRDVLAKQERFTWGAAPPEPEPKKEQQRKKGGRGWVHSKK